jgi:phosphoribosylanthranilate isomerase
MRTRVKICGFTQVENAVEAAYLGADAIGLVFYDKSPRHVGIEQAARIVRALPAFVSVVGLFVDAQPEEIRAVLQQMHLDVLQFHGDERAEECRLYGMPYIKAIRMQADTRIGEWEAQYHDAAGLLLDAYHPGIQGGSGSSFDWDLIPGQRSLPLILAGGLDAANARQAIQRVQPYALDVSSGVEAAKGIKDPQKMADFIKNTYC